MTRVTLPTSTKVFPNGYRCNGIIPSGDLVFEPGETHVIKNTEAARLEAAQPKVFKMVKIDDDPEPAEEEAAAA